MITILSPNTGCEPPLRSHEPDFDQLTTQPETPEHIDRQKARLILGTLVRHQNDQSIFKKIDALLADLPF